jgi:uncharacterized membrane protein YtjA (UPF0391 family)
MGASTTLSCSMLSPGPRFSKFQIISLPGLPARRAEAERCGTHLEPAPPFEVRSVAQAPARREGLRETTMTLLKWALIFFVVSIIAGILGFTGISAASADVARFLFYIFVVIFLILLVLGLTIFRV